MSLFGGNLSSNLICIIIKSIQCTLLKLPFHPKLTYLFTFEHYSHTMDPRTCHSCMNFVQVLKQFKASPNPNLFLVDTILSWSTKVCKLFKSVKYLVLCVFREIICSHHMSSNKLFPLKTLGPGT